MLNPEKKQKPIELTHKTVKTIKVYKVVPRGTPSLSAYSQATDPALQDDLDGTNSTQLEDWKALYTQFLAEHTLGTIPYRWERNHEESFLQEATIAEVDVVIVDGSILHDRAISGTEKAQIIKKELSMDPNVPLMKGLGLQHKAALVRETEKEWELILPHELLKSLQINERTIARFQKHSKFPVTAKWCFDGGPWQVWDEDCPPVFQDLDTKWILER